MAFVGTSERESIEDYLRTYALEECLDEAINEVVETRPKNPYMSIASLMETKTLPEIIDVTLTAIIVGKCGGGVQATVETNIAKFIGVAAFPSNDGEDILKDFTVQQESLRQALTQLDPRNMAEIDSTLSNIPSLDVTASLAVSIACCRAGARHLSKPLYRYLADCAGTSNRIVIPVPVISVLSRAAQGSSAVQDITLIPTGFSSLDYAIDAALKVSSLVEAKILSNKLSQAPSNCGCPSVYLPTLEEAIKLVRETLEDPSILSGSSLSCGVDLRSQLSFQTEGSGAGKYQMGPVTDDLTGSSAPPAGKDAKAKKAAAPSKSQPGMNSGEEVMESLLFLWRNSLLFSIEDPLHSSDLNSWKFLQDKINEAVLEAKASFPPDKLPSYAKGLGGKNDCVFQIVLDTYVSCKQDLVSLFSGQHIASANCNAVKIRLQKVGSISNVIEICTAARELGLAVIVGYDEGQPECTDTFIADLAVALGAGQFAAGGAFEGEYLAKYNRLMEISREDPSIEFAGKNFRR